MIAVCPSLTAFVAWLEADESRAALNSQRTPSVQSGDVGAARLAPGLLIPEDCPVVVYTTLAEAMAAYPALPWHLLSVWSGTPAEPELIAARAAWEAANATVPE
jgi:hypothetical protein